jgi:NAD(P)-dependent dehydrogenase (short-subunit alcohol dehydrogenase family)
MSPIDRIGEPDPDRGTAAEVAFPGRFAGKTVLVTGAASGIGRATARRLAAEGGTVACLDVSLDGAESVVAEIQAADDGSGGRGLAVHCDVTDEASVVGAVRTVTAELGPPTVVCNVAGIGRFFHITELSLDDWDKMIAVNLTGTFLVCRETMPGLLEHGGVIINTSSTAGKMGQPYSAAYCASKGGVTLLTKALAVEMAGRGVRVNAIAPGGVDTPLIWEFGFPEGADPKKLDRIMSPVGFSTAGEVAGAFAYLGSDEASYITGAILSVDGALTA